MHPRQILKMGRNLLRERPWPHRRRLKRISVFLWFQPLTQDLKKQLSTPGYRQMLSELSSHVLRRQELLPSFRESTLPPCGS